MKLRHLISAKDIFDRPFIEELFKEAAEMEKRVERGVLIKDCEGKILAALFYEPSTRTRLSFESAMQRVGGSVISAENAADYSSAKKGETLEDTARMVSSYADVIVIRHPEPGSAARLASVAHVPVINGGDGSGEHPTQALLDLYTIQKELGRIDTTTIAFVGDLRYGRTVHSLLHLLPLFRAVQVLLVSSPELRLPEEYRTALQKHNVAFEESSDLLSAVQKSDVLFVTRIQKERFPSEEEYKKLKGSYTIDDRTLAALKKTAIIMHPLPRVDEIAREVDKDPRAAYFREAKNGVFVRMALIRSILT